MSQITGTLFEKDIGKKLINEWFISKNVWKVSKINQVSTISNGNIMVKSCQKFPNMGGSQKIKNFPSSKISLVGRGGGVSQNLGTVPKLYLVINHDGFPKLHYLTWFIAKLWPTHY